MAIVIIEECELQIYGEDRGGYVYHHSDIILWGAMYNMCNIYNMYNMYNIKYHNKVGSSWGSVVRTERRCQPANIFYVYDLDQTGN